MTDKAPDRVPVRRALLSVSDKSGLIELGKDLASFAVELLSTGGSAKTLREALQIMAEMRDQKKIDAELFELFLTSRVWQKYAEHYMPSDLRNGVDIAPLRVSGTPRYSETSTLADVG